MKKEENASGFDPVKLSSAIVAAYVLGNSLPPAELPRLIESVHSAVIGLGSSRSVRITHESPVAEKATAADIRKSVRPGGLVSFIDGRVYKTLKRHLRAHGFNPHSYRERYGLPDDYPMVAANYAAKRSELAKAIGLGRPISADGELSTSDREAA